MPLFTNYDIARKENIGFWLTRLFYPFCYCKKKSDNGCSFFLIKNQGTDRASIAETKANLHDPFPNSGIKLGLISR